VYGDVRSHAVPGAPEEVRRDYLNDYLQHPHVLAGVGPTSIEATRSYLNTTFSPLANAAWEREAGYGWTMVSAEQMGAYVSSQVHALRYFSATTGQPQDHWGFAWAPRNAAGISPEEFATRSGLVLDRLAAAIRDSAQTTDPADPGSAACGPPGQNVYCALDLEGARLNEAWKSFRTWTQPVLEFATPPQTIPAGTPSAAMSLELVTGSGLAATTPLALSVTVASSSSTGAFSASPQGPWSRTLPLTIAAGTRTSPAFYYLDRRAGSPVLTATATGATSGTQTVTVAPGAISALRVTPKSVRVPARASQRFAALGVDAFGNAFPVAVTWSLRPGGIGRLAARTGNTTSFTAGRTVGQGTVNATATNPSGRVSGAADLNVTPGRLRIGSITYRAQRRAVLVTVSAQDAAARPISGATVSALVRNDGRRYATARAQTGASGRTVYRIPLPGRGGCLATTIRGVSVAGFAWDGRTPRNRHCTPRTSSER
jgi:hypothetical protein